MTRIELTGLRSDLPIGAMAAFGCLRICERRPALRGSKLGWAASGGAFHAVLWTPAGQDRESLTAELLEDVRGAGERRELTWNDQIKTATARQYSESAREAIEHATAEDREAADWFAAFGSELVTDREGKIQATPFDMSAARQRFLADATRLGSALAGGESKGKTSEASYVEALFGPWRYEDDQHSLGWDPSTMKMGAFTHRAPTSMANSGVRAAVWLAFESLPLFPCFAAGGRLRVRGFGGTGREQELFWPVWETGLGITAVEALLGLAPVADPDDLAARGVVAAYRSERFKPNQYLAFFRPAELVFGGVLRA